MMEQEEVVNILENAQRMLSEMSVKKFDIGNVSVDAEQISFMVKDLQKRKTELKEKFCKAVTRNHLMRCLSAPRTQWATLVCEADAELQKAKDILHEAKQKADKQKEEIIQLNAVVLQGLSVYKQQMKLLGERIKTLETLVQDMQKVKRQTEQSSLTKTVCKELEEQIQHTQSLQLQCQRRLLDAEHAVTQLQAQAVSKKMNLMLMDEMWDAHGEKIDKEHLTKLQKCLAAMTELSGVQCQLVSQQRLVIKVAPCLMPEKARATLQAKGNFEKGQLPILSLTLMFETDSLGCVYISTVQSDVESLDISDLWQERKLGLEYLPGLVQAIKTRWSAHVPLLAEINRLRNSFAVDWIQKESTLRVIMGKGGSVVCSLTIPPSYPERGEICLASVVGAPDLERVGSGTDSQQDSSKLQPPCGGCLDDWMLFLEKTFGKP